MTIHKTNRWHWQADWTGMVEFPIGRHLVRVPLEEMARMARELSPYTTTKSWADGVYHIAKPNWRIRERCLEYAVTR